MRCSLCVLASWFAFTVAASARLGETQAECQERYGQPVTNYPGEGAVAGCGVYVKDGIAITAIFVKTAGKDSRAGLVIYSRTRPDAAQGFYIPPPALSSDEQTSLLGTVAGRWEKYDAPPALTGKPTKVLPLTTQPTLTLKQRDSAMQTVQKAVEALYPYSLRAYFGSGPKDLGHNGPKIFAFHVARGLAISSSDASAPIAAWADRVILERRMANRPPKSKLNGF